MRDNVDFKIKKLSDVQSCKTLIVIPKKDQSCDKTRLDLRAELNPKEHKILNFRNGKTGQILIQFESENEHEKAKRAIETKLGCSYTTSDPLRRFRVSGMSENLENEEIIDLIKTQNEGFPGKCIKILGRYENKSFKYQKWAV